MISLHHTRIRLNQVVRELGSTWIGGDKAHEGGIDERRTDVNKVKRFLPDLGRWAYLRRWACLIDWHARPWESWELPRPCGVQHRFIVGTSKPEHP